MLILEYSSHFYTGLPRNVSIKKRKKKKKKTKVRYIVKCINQNQTLSITKARRYQYIIGGSLDLPKLNSSTGWRRHSPEPWPDLNLLNYSNIFQWIEWLLSINDPQKKTRVKLPATHRLSIGLTWGFLGLLLRTPYAGRISPPNRCILNTHSSFLVASRTVPIILWLPLLTLYFA